MIIGFAGGYGLWDGWMSFALYHIGGLGASSLLACMAGTIAAKKGRGYWRAFTLALSLPILLGVIAAYLVTPATDGGRPAACGGSVSLAVALIFIVAWTFVKRKQVRTA
jgi:hypothetical protein